MDTGDGEKFQRSIAKRKFMETLCTTGKGNTIDDE